MDTIELIVNQEPEPHVLFQINGRDLVEIIGDDSSPDGWLTMTAISCFQESTIFADQPQLPSDRLVVLVCSCGELACSNTTVRITRAEDAVIWSDFAEGWQENFAKYRRIGPFKFSPDQYDQVIKRGREFAAKS